jgi:hypothetical protein
MNLCSRHDGEEVCFESSNCPACEIEQNLKEAQSEIEDLKQQVAALNAEE